MRVLNYCPLKKKKKKKKFVLWETIMIKLAFGGENVGTTAPCYMLE
jgi:hypothetical protein